MSICAMPAFSDCSYEEMRLLSTVVSLLNYFHNRSIGTGNERNNGPEAQKELDICGGMDSDSRWHLQNRVQSGWIRFVSYIHSERSWERS